MKEKEGSQFQSLGSMLAFILPILQLFLNYLPDKSKDIFLIKDQLIVVSIIAAVFSYVAILIFKNIQYFNITLPRKHRAYIDYISKLDPKAYSQEEIKEYVRTNPAVYKPFYITFDNITYLVLFPLMILSWSLFFYLGLSTNPNNVRYSLIFWQAISYISLVASTALSLAIFYIRDTSRRNWQQKQESLFSNVVTLLYENSAIEEFPNIFFVTQFQPDFARLLTVIKVNGDNYYKIITDVEAQKLQAVEKYPTEDALKNSIGRAN